MKRPCLSQEALWKNIQSAVSNGTPPILAIKKVAGCFHMIVILQADEHRLWFYDPNGKGTICGPEKKEDILPTKDMEPGTGTGRLHLVVEGYAQ